MTKAKRSGGHRPISIPVVSLLETSRDDDHEFIARLGRIATGALVVYKPQELFVVHIDNWFGHKWRGFSSSKWFGEPGAGGHGLRIPPFYHNRVLSQRHFMRNEDESGYQFDGPGRRLHVRKIIAHCDTKPLEALSASVALLWYSGNTRQNRAGTMMFYVSDESGEDCWYLAFEKSDSWEVKQTVGVTRSQIEYFGKCGDESKTC